MRLLRLFHAASLSVFLVACLSMPSFAQPGANFFQVIYDITSPVSETLEPDMGYAVYVSFEGKKFLMDTGTDPDMLANNLKAAGVPLDDLDFVFLSHRHGDHTGGLPYVRSARPSLRIYVPPGGGFDGKGLIEVEDHLKVSPNIFIIRTHNAAGHAGITDELSLLIKAAKGPYLITACTHTGLFAILEKARRVAGQEIFFYTGGSGLNRAMKLRVTDTAKRLKALSVAHVSPGHCSAGAWVQEIFKGEFETNYVPSRLGEKVPLEPAAG